ncbi:hypothetical protein GCM10023196_036600 [Actinoallomurus vinaceus]|uniref:Uncharacterized protein n=1 Tax=Actinoallomurus vinaceus TaxID=1080074 RepID=A0ABP8UAR1_9ACTN
MAELQRPRMLIDLLSAALVRRGLRVQVRGDLVTAINPRVRSQGVRLRETPDGLMWCWVWVGLRPADRGARMPAPDVEPFCPAGEIGQAADRIAKVVSGIGEPADA